jgi:hypothetical protein
VRQELPSLGQERSPRVGQLDTSTAPVKQPHAELSLETADLVAERRLRDVQSLRGTAEVELLRDRNEVLDQP